MTEIDYTEKFKYMDKRMEDIEHDQKELRKHSDENENGKILIKMQVLFDGIKEDAVKKELRDEKRDEKVEERAEKRDLAIAQIGKDVSQYSGNTEALSLKVTTLSEKVDVLEEKVSNNSEKTKIDTSVWFKSCLIAIGGGCMAIIILLVRKWLNI